MPNNLIDLEKPPIVTNEYLSADYIELLCLTNIDGVISKEQVASRIFKLKDIDSDLDELQKEAESEELDLLHLDTNEEILPNPKYPLNEKQQRQTVDWFDQLEFRENNFSNFYPFYLSEDKGLLHQCNEISSQKKLYIFLLLASNLRCFSKQDQTRLANYFEIVCVAALKQYLSSASQVHLFGHNPLNDGRYSGSLWERIVRFATDIGDEPRRTERYYPSGKRGERGLDVVGWLPFSDNSEGLLVVTGQSACSPDDWEDKQLTSHSARWKTHINFTVEPTNTVFIPHSYRQSNGEWYDVTRINDSILLDRLRLVNLLSESIEQLDEEFPHDLVEQLISLEESVV